MLPCPNFLFKKKVHIKQKTSFCFFPLLKIDTRKKVSKYKKKQDSFFFFYKNLPTIYQRNECLRQTFRSLLCKKFILSGKYKFMKRIKALSFFTGAMGLDLGLKKAGIEIVLACESEKFIRDTIKLNTCGIGIRYFVNVVRVLL